jgi:transcription initiation factor TFIIH subunit 1
LTTFTSQLKINKKSGDAALLAMTQNVSARLEIKMKKSASYFSLYRLAILQTIYSDDIPPELFSQMTTCQTAANEFLRQFWSCMYPPAAEQQALAPATPSQKAAKAAKMIGYLGKTPEKVDALIRTAQVEGIDATKVEIVRAFALSYYLTTQYKLQAMKPILDAVDRALAFHRSRKPPK